MSSSWLCLVALAALSACAAAAALPDEITDLPGAPDLNFKQYAGYVNVDSASGRNLFYWFVESQNDPANDPVVIWLNGGPGCSSLGGLLSENGPFWPNEKGDLDLNPSSWNRVANVVYLESPAGVGFSYSLNKSDYTVGDKRTTDDSYAFLLTFFERYPQFADNEFWVSGESYGGHYVPLLAWRIAEGNKAGNAHINLQGHLVGNAWTEAALNNIGSVVYWQSHALNSQTTYEGLIANCNFSAIGPLAAAQEAFYGNELGAVDPKACDEFQNLAMTEMGNINIYDIYETVCLVSDAVADNQGSRLLRALAAGNPSDGPHVGLARGLLGKISSAPKQRSASAAATTAPPAPAPPCIDNYVQSYLNDAKVQAAIHANQDLGYQWTDCSPRVNYSYSDLLSSVVPVYLDLLKEPVRMLVYSGDVDAIVPNPGMFAWVETISSAIGSPTSAWAPWSIDGQVGGYATGYLNGNFTVTTVRNAGHMVPGTQPERAFHMFDRFIKNKPF